MRSSGTLKSSPAEAVRVRVDIGEMRKEYKERWRIGSRINRDRKKGFYGGES
jgi:hypothetical protein